MTAIVVEISVDMLGPIKYYTKGKITRKHSAPMNATLKRIDAHNTIRQLHNDEEISVEVMHLNYVPFLTSILEGTHCGNAGAVDNLKCAPLENELKNVIRACSVRGFRAGVIQVDMQFKALKDRNLVSAASNAVSRYEHVKKIERWHRVIKERCRFYCAMLPFDYLPRVMVTHLLKTVVFCINTFAWKKRVSQITPPLAIIE